MKINVKGDSIETMYSMIPNKSKVMHFEVDIINFSPIRHKIYAYHRKENNCGDESSIILLDYDQLGNTIINGNQYINDNSIMEIRY